jgi:hypothetical protein
VPVKSKVKLSQNFVSFSEYINFNFCKVIEFDLANYCKIREISKNTHGFSNPIFLFSMKL